MRLLEHKNVTLCFEPGSLSAEFVAGMVERGVGIKIAQVRGRFLGRSSSRKLSASVLSDFRAQAGFPTSEFLSGSGAQTESFGVFFHPAAQFEAVVWDAPLSEKLRSAVDAFVQLPGFSIGYLHDAYELFWQSVTSVDTYRTFGREVSNEKVVIRDGERVVDNSCKPARREIAPGMWLGITQEMWFGAPSLRFFPRERLVSFPDAEVVEEVRGGIIHVRLYSDRQAGVIDADSKLSAFRAWVGIDQLGDLWADQTAGESDWTFRMTTGEFPHGGERLIEQAVDRFGRPAPRSRCVRIIRWEVDRHGRSVWTEASGP